MKKASKYTAAASVLLLLGGVDVARAVHHSAIADENFVELESQALNWGGIVPQLDVYSLLDGGSHDGGQGHDSDTVGPGGIQQKNRMPPEKGMAGLGSPATTTLIGTAEAPKEGAKLTQLKDRDGAGAGLGPSLQLSSQRAGAQPKHSQGSAAGTEDLLQGGNLALLICGSVLLLIALPIIFMNERKMARTSYVLSRGNRECLPNVPSTGARKQSTNFKLVHCIGRNHTDEPVRDEQFAVHLNQTIRLVRRVEMLQWVEVKREE